MRKIIDFAKKYYFVIIVIVAIVIKCVMTMNLPINARDEAGADEYLMLYQAEQLASGNYLGPYNYLTLVKGISFPLFLAFSYKIGIPLLLLYSIFCVGACLVALVPLRRMIKSKPLLLVSFLMLLFCPAMMDNNVQLVYRNMLIVPQSILLVSALMMMYYHVKDKKTKKMAAWSVVVALDWVFLWYTREDAIWSAPLVVVVIIVLLCSIIKENKTRIFDRKVLDKVAVVLLPVVILVMGGQVISFINYQHYGIYTTNQLNKSNYTKAVMAMMRVKPEKEVERVEITRETLLRLYEISPSLAELKDTIEKDYTNKNGLVMAGEDNGEINEDLITWELTGAASAAGYYKDAETAEEYWGRVYEEIATAINDGGLETRATLPSRSLIPYPGKEGSFGEWMSSIVELFDRAAKYQSSGAEVYESKIDDLTVRRYETVTGGYVVRETVDGVVDPMEAKATRWVTYANRITKLYSLIGPIGFFLGLLYYLILTIYNIVMVIRRKMHGERMQVWLFLSAILGGVTVMLAGLSYVNAFMVDVGGYLVSAEGLICLFGVTTMVLVVQDTAKMIKIVCSKNNNGA